MEITLYSDRGPRWLKFHDPTGRRSFSCSAVLNIDGDERSVRLEMIDVYRADMLGFFEEIAAQGDSWRGSKRWESEFSEMSIDAENSGGGIVSLSVRLAPSDEEESPFGGELHCRVDALARAASDMRAFLGTSDGRRFTRRIES